jgi:hypothetical protein
MTHVFRFINHVAVSKKLPAGDSVTICHDECDENMIAKWQKAVDDESLLNDSMRQQLKENSESVGKTAADYLETRKDRCSKEFRQMCTDMSAAFAWKLQQNGNDRIELWNIPDTDEPKRVDSFQQDYSGKKTCWKEAGTWDCSHKTKNTVDDFPTSHLTATCDPSAVAPTAPPAVVSYLGPQPLSAFTATSPIFHIDMFTAQCNPKTCAEWTCTDWCECFEDDNVIAMFGSLQYEASLAALCPIDDDQDTCNCGQL